MLGGDIEKFGGTGLPLPIQSRSGNPRQGTADQPYSGPEAETGVVPPLLPVGGTLTVTIPTPPDLHLEFFLYHLYRDPSLGP